MSRAAAHIQCCLEGKSFQPVQAGNSLYSIWAASLTGSEPLWVCSLYRPRPICLEASIWVWIFLYLLRISVCATVFHILLYHFGVSHSVSILFWEPDHPVASIWKWRWNLGAIPGLILCVWDHTFVVYMCVSTCTGQLRCLW